MAWRLRIRHKLLFGLVWVGVPMLVLLAATLHALHAHRTTVKSIESRHPEQKAVEALQNILKSWQARHGSSTLVSAAELDELALDVLEAVQKYESHLNATLTAGRDHDRGFEERGFLVLMREQVKALRGVAGSQSGLQVNSVQQDSRSGGIIKRLADQTVTLGEIIDSDVRHLVTEADKSYRQTRQLVLAVSAGGFLLLLFLARVTYTWIAGPIRELHTKITQVAQGNFTGRVQVSSRDEMYDLAAAFNHMADRLQETYRDLERQVAERSKQLVRSERLAGVGFLAAGVAHEINNPLASISFCGEALERRLKDLLAQHPGNPDVPLIQRYVGMIQQEAFRCKEITQKLLEFSRMGDRPRQMSDLAALVQGVLEMVQHLPNHKEKRIVFEVHSRPHLLLSAPEIKSVVLNLIVNALESMELGGLLTIRLDVINEHVLLNFTDTGCGMTQEVLDNLFEPFFTRSRTGKGTGLGLSISHRIINQHGGDIEATSPGPNQGSTFTVKIPLRQAEQAPQQDPVAAVLKKAA